MPTTKMPVWIRSEYVTIGQPPLSEDQGTEAAPCVGANRLPYAGSAERSLFPVPRIPYAAKKGNQKISVSKSADVFGFDMKKTAPHRAALDNSISGGYTKHRKGAAGRRLTRRYYLEK